MQREHDLIGLGTQDLRRKLELHADGEQAMHPWSSLSCEELDNIKSVFLTCPIGGRLPLRVDDSCLRTVIEQYAHGIDLFGPRGSH